ncbi:unnamed protein product [Brassica napus]|uniref:(rape) hypothetical protein n=1 Tax=Brassica napus TaxID=3708 RepID=A0A816YBS6_BRANA|nr:unnamed protein product [Brassica napus]
MVVAMAEMLVTMDEEDITEEDTTEVEDTREVEDIMGEEDTTAVEDKQWRKRWMIQGRKRRPWGHGGRGGPR